MFANLRRLALPAALLAMTLVPTGARADEVLEQRRVALEEVLLHRGEMAERGRAAHSVAALNTPGAARVFVDAATRLGERLEELEKEREQLREAYEPYSGFTFKDPKAWDIKKRLRKQLDQSDEFIAADGVVLLAFATAATKFTDDEAVGIVRKSASSASTAHVRRVLYSGLLRNALVPPATVGKKGLADPSAEVRLAVLEALAERKDPVTEDLGIKALKEKGWPHRQAAARLLGEAGTVASIGPLVQAMMLEEGRLIEVYAESLRKLTNATIGPFPDAWKAWYDENKGDLSEQGARAVGVRKPKKNVEAIDYYGIETRSRRIVFLLDISGSMKEVIGAEGEITGGDEEVFNGKKIDIAKSVLKQAIRNLPEEVMFNVITFNHDVKSLSPSAMEATQDNKNKVYLAVNDIEPRGATFTYGALDMTFQMAGRGLKDKYYDPGVDTIFVLSDGAPTTDSVDKAVPMDPEQILRSVRDWNQLKRIQIHAIAIDPSIGSGTFVRFMKSLARENKGTYREIGSDGRLSSPLDK